MIHQVDEQDGHILLHFGSRPENIGQITFVTVVAHKHRKILYAKWREDESWTLPSGRVKPDETAEAAAHRELIEETGATVTNLEVLCYVHSFMFGLDYWGITYLGEVSSLSTFTDTDEVAEVAFWAKLPEPITDQFRGQAEALHQAAQEHLQMDGWKNGRIGASNHPFGST